MSGMDSAEVCCACLSTTLLLNKVVVTNGNKPSLHTKLKICVPEIDWLVSSQICERCIKLLDISYTFRQICLKSEQIRQKEASEKQENHDIMLVEEEVRDKVDLTEECDLNELKVKTEVKIEFEEEEYQIDSIDIDEPDLVKLEVKKEVEDKADLSGHTELDIGFNTDDEYVEIIKPKKKIQKRGDDEDESIYNDFYEVGADVNLVEPRDESKDVASKQQLDKKGKRPINWYLSKYQCKICNKTAPVHYLFKQYLKKHVRNHFKPYDCRVCGKKFLDNYTYRKHLKNKHLIQVL